MPLVDHGMHIKTVNTQNSLTHSYDKTNSIETSSSFYNQVISNILATRARKCSKFLLLLGAN